MIELETMLMQFCLETSGRREGDRYPVGKGRGPASGPGLWSRNARQAWAGVETAAGVPFGRR
jgi:hypothetical protein